MPTNLDWIEELKKNAILAAKDDSALNWITFRNGTSPDRILSLISMVEERGKRVTDVACAHCQMALAKSEARNADLLAQVEKARVEGFNEGVSRASKTASYFTVRPEASIHPDIPWDKMNETAKMIAHTTAQQISWEIAELKASDSRRGGE